MKLNRVAVAAKVAAVLRPIPPAPTPVAAPLAQRASTTEPRAGTALPPKRP